MPNNSLNLTLVERPERHPQYNALFCLLVLRVPRKCGPNPIEQFQPSIATILYMEVIQLAANKQKIPTPPK